MKFTAIKPIYWLQFLLISTWFATLNAASLPIQGMKPFELPTWFKTSFLDIKEDVQEAKTANKRVILFFEQSNCPYCAHFIQTNFSNPKIQEYIQKHFDIISINLWGDREITNANSLGIPNPISEKALCAKLNIWATPTILFLDEYGAAVLRLNGHYDPDNFMLAMRYVAEKQETKMSMSEFFAVSQQQQSQGTLIAEDFFALPPYDLRSSIIKKPLMVVFEEPGSKASERLHKEVLQHPKTIKQLQSFHVIQLDVRADIPLILPNGKKQTTQAWIKMLRLNTFPTVLLFAKGKEILRLDAMFKAFHFQALLSYVASGAYRTQLNIQRYLQTYTENLQKQGVQINIWH